MVFLRNFHQIFVHYIGKLRIGTADEKRRTQIGNDCKHRRLRGSYPVHFPNIAIAANCFIAISCYNGDLGVFL